MLLASQATLERNKSTKDFKRNLSQAAFSIGSFINSWKSRKQVKSDFNTDFITPDAPPNTPNDGNGFGTGEEQDIFKLNDTNNSSINDLSEMFSSSMNFTNDHKNKLFDVDDLKSINKIDGSSSIIDEINNEIITTGGLNQPLSLLTQQQLALQQALPLQLPQQQIPLNTFVTVRSQPIPFQQQTPLPYPPTTQSTLPQQIFLQPKKIVCPHCSKVYKHNSGLRYHLNAAHSNVKAKPFVCKFGCKNEYRNLSGLKYHYEHSHVGQFEDLNSLLEEAKKSQKGENDKGLGRNIL